MLTTREAAQLLERQDNILILTHRRPDGDTIGCAAGLCAALRLRGKEAYILPNPDVTAVNAVYAAPYWAPEGYEPSFVVSVDIAARSLFFPAAEAYFPRIGLAIDHHPSFEGFGAAQCVDPSRAACGEIVYEICRELGEVTAEVALPLYAAVATDTGCFVYANTTANTHMVAAALLTLWRYRHVAQTQFGGISGDLAGWFLQKTEIWMLAALVVCRIVEAGV